ncbi:hypothetical protein PSTG_16134 [Puccinia striiformis f. sp. tritici PST-78]|uniref:5'-3' DNA helicase ZGRF1-like N-terminal domain-containing protein n=1 Tax=Puccinia striiformis f. sp. tritici PST-78 TaxID=1165861 RepID=A0A0L0UTS2_9BASI|nr:hypothetical protein PSTG_16134 [Puccinia striiformis f. sp. tritici PST-78]
MSDQVGSDQASRDPAGLNTPQRASHSRYLNHQVFTYLSTNSYENLGSQDMSHTIKTDDGQGSSLSSTRSVVVKKYTCMYTTDIQKQRKIWHDGFIRMRHVNAKVYLLAEDGHTLAESFMKLSSSRAQPESNPDRLNYSKVHSEFCLDEDEEIEFDPVEDSETRPSSYMARIVDFVKVELENVPLLPPLNTKARQDLHKRKMEYLDETIQQFSKRTKPGSSPHTSQLADAIPPSTPIPSASKRKMPGFETRQFNSPLMNRSKQSSSIDTPTLARFRPPPTTKPTPNTVPRLQYRQEPQCVDDQHQKVDTQYTSDGRVHKDDSSPPPVQPRSPNNPPSPPKTNPFKVDDRPRSEDPPINPSKHKNLSPSVSSSSSNRVSNHKTLKVNWDSFFQAAKPS